MPERKGENLEALCPKRVRFPRFVMLLPYAEILAVEDTKAIVIDTLLNELHRLERYKELLDVVVLRQEIQARFGVEIGV